jgi:hypothetical protein
MKNISSFAHVIAHIIISSKYHIGKQPKDESKGTASQRILSSYHIHIHRRYRLFVQSSVQNVAK